MKPITDHRSLIDALGGGAALASKLEGCTAGRVRQWKIGNRIPVEYWPEIIMLAAEADFEGITSDWLMVSIRPREMPTSQEAAA